MTSKKLMLGATVVSVAMLGVGCSSSDNSTESAASSETSNTSLSQTAVESATADQDFTKDLSIDPSLVGKVIKKEPLKTEEIISAPNGAETMLVTYGSRNAAGDPIAETGLVTLPKGEAPEGGWPVLSWAHGTTGLAAKCAPSEALNSHPDEEALTMVAQDYLQVWLDKGFAVIQPDYQGLGTTGEGTYMDRQSLASAVNEMVRATREEFKFNEKWYNTGWSQGGFAAVSAASADSVPSGLVKTLAIAPGDTQAAGTQMNAEAAQQAAHKAVAAVDEANLAYGAYTVQGAMNFNPKIKAEDLFNDEGMKVLDMASTECLTTFKERNKIPGEDILKDQVNALPLLEHLTANSMIGMNPKTPIVIFISEDDDIINYAQISSSAKKLSENEGTDVTIEVRTGEGHRDMVRRAIEDQTPYVPELQ